jgi:hypothetical protein
MLVIALSRLVVEAQNAHLVDHERQTILETVAAARNRVRELPNHNIGKAAFADDPSLSQEKPRPHVGVYTNAGEIVNARSLRSVPAGLALPAAAEGLRPVPAREPRQGWITAMSELVFEVTQDEILA